MNLLLSRDFKKSSYTIGRLYIDDVFFCNTLEDVDRGLNSSMSESYIKLHKVYGQTAIPTGTYEVVLNEQSPRFSQKAYYKSFCNGYLPRLKDVKGFEGVLIHPGNAADDSLGCILVGKNTIPGRLTDSRATFESLYKKLSNQSSIKLTIR